MNRVNWSVMRQLVYRGICNSLPAQPTNTEVEARYIESHAMPEQLAFLDAVKVQAIISACTAREWGLVTDLQLAYYIGGEVQSDSRYEASLS